MLTPYEDLKAGIANQLRIMRCMLGHEHPKLDGIGPMAVFVDPKKGEHPLVFPAAVARDEHRLLRVLRDFVRLHAAVRVYLLHEVWAETKDGPAKEAIAVYALDRDSELVLSGMQYLERPAGGGKPIFFGEPRYDHTLPSSRGLAPQIHDLWVDMEPTSHSKRLN